jgi:hypothetical protein
MWLSVQRMHAHTASSTCHLLHCIRGFKREGINEAVLDFKQVLVNSVVSCVRTRPEREEKKKKIRAGSLRDKAV